MLDDDLNGRHGSLLPMRLPLTAGKGIWLALMSSFGVPSAVRALPRLSAQARKKEQPAPLAGNRLFCMTKSA